MKWLALQPRDYKFLLICRCYVSHFPYDQILHDWIERVKFEPEWVYFEAEILVQCAHHDEKILAVDKPRPWSFRDQRNVHSSYTAVP
jgi:hypothetical protein